MTLSQLIYKTINFHRQEFAGCWDSWVKKVQDKRNENSFKNFLNLPFIRFLLFALLPFIACQSSQQKLWRKMLKRLCATACYVTCFHQKALKVTLPERLLTGYEWQHIWRNSPFAKKIPQGMLERTDNIVCFFLWLMYQTLSLSRPCLDSAMNIE